MKFGDKVKKLRMQKNMTQEELSKAISVSPRTVFSYENGESYPRKREIYKRLADFFEVELNYLLTEDEEFIIDAKEKYGRKGEVQAQNVLEQVAALFAGGELSAEDKFAFVHEIQELYMDSKERAKKKFTPKKYRTDKV